MRLILASTSPLRRSILEQAGFTFKCVKPSFKEVLPPDARAEDAAVSLAEGKARSVADRFPNAVVIGADQVCEFNGELLGKPRAASTARVQLARLAGESHRLVTGVTVFGAVTTGGGVRRVQCFIDETRLTFRALTDEELDAYVATNEWRGCAGGYRIEGRGIHLVERIQGDYFNILGLPLIPLLKTLRRFGLNALLTEDIPTS